MKPLNDSEVNEIINLAYDSCQKYILNYVNKKDFKNIQITINLNTTNDSFNIDIDIDLDSDMKLPENLANSAIDVALEAVDEYVENRNN